MPGGKEKGRILGKREEEAWESMHRSRPAPPSGLGSKSHALPEPSLDCGSLVSGKHTNSFCWVNEVDDWEES